MKNSPDISALLADGREVETLNNTQVNEMEIETTGCSFWKRLTQPSCAHLPSDFLFLSAWRVFKVDRSLAVSLNYKTSSDVLRMSLKTVS